MTTQTHLAPAALTPSVLAVFFQGFCRDSFSPFIKWSDAIERKGQRLSSPSHFQALASLEKEETELEKSGLPSATSAFNQAKQIFLGLLFQRERQMMTSDFGGGMERCAQRWINSSIKICSQTSHRRTQSRGIRRPLRLAGGRLFDSPPLVEVQGHPNRKIFPSGERWLQRCKYCQAGFLHCSTNHAQRVHSRIVLSALCPRGTWREVPPVALLSISQESYAILCAPPLPPSPSLSWTTPSYLNPPGDWCRRRGGVATRERARPEVENHTPLQIFSHPQGGCANTPTFFLEFLACRA